MNFYPYSSPIVLTDDIFTLYGGHLTNSVPAQRQAAFLIAEMTATEDLDTFLLPTMVTGTFHYTGSTRFILDHAYVHHIYLTQFIDEEEDIYYTVSGTNNIYVSVRNDERSIVDVDTIFSNCNCHHHGGHPYQVRFVYQAGLQSGTSFKPDVLLGLTTYADIVLNEIIGYGNEAPGDIGVQEFRNQQYSEKRVALLRTSFGTSARANFAHNLLKRLRLRRYVGI